VRPDSRKPGASKGENESLAQRVRLSAQRPFLDQARVIGNDGSESRPRIRSGHRPGGDGLRLWIFAGAKNLSSPRRGVHCTWGSLAAGLRSSPLSVNRLDMKRAGRMPGLFFRLRCLEHAPASPGRAARSTGNAACRLTCRSSGRPCAPLPP
jgi:hypothetical protein